MLKFINCIGKEIVLDYSFPYFIERHSGLTGMSSNTNTSRNYKEDGCILTGHTYKERDIDIYVVVQGDSEEELEILKRKALNTIVGEGTLYYIEGETTRKIDGYIRETPRFSEAEGLFCERFQFSMLCPDPYWHDVVENRMDMGTWINDLEFPVDILASKTILGHKDTSVMKSIYVEGDVNSPIRIEMFSTDVVDNPCFENVTTGEKICLEVTLNPGEKICLETTPGKKKILRVKNNKKENILYTLSINSKMFSLQSGDNLIKISATRNVEFMQAFLYYNNNYSGV